MWIKLYPPFGKGKEWEEIALPSPATVRQLIDRIRMAHPELEPYFLDSVEETFHHLTLIREDHVLRADDRIEPRDQIAVMMPITGG